ncbi:hypothetical protein AVEN_142382-1 [Araneus ventricosus]|uniref:Uncharacterized protein n=1 Tax=Araneus ventricosus TaxID=182803 RepID=A0A4Y2PC75_ARAVE|nr:hypothetical protein AVEN_142382-1 [Araneus ventricosus]
MILCDVTTSRTRVHKRMQFKGGFVCSASWKAGELSVIESAVTVIISDLLTACVAKSESAVTLITCELLSVALLICTRSIVPVTCATCFLYIWK